MGLVDLRRESAGIDDELHRFVHRPHGRSLHRFA